jgi:hypothetical protein
MNLFVTNPLRFLYLVIHFYGTAFTDSYFGY